MNKKGENFAFSDTFVEITILNYLANCTHFKWIARDQEGCLCVYDKKPQKAEDVGRTNPGYWFCDDDEYDSASMIAFNSLFQNIKWETSEPTSIQEVLDNCEVIDDDL